MPFLGDLPLFGGLFRNEEMKATRTELLIVLTPHVIDSPSSPVLKEMSADVSARMPLLEGAKKQILEGQLDGSSSLFNGDFESEGEAEVDFTVPRTKPKDD